MGIRAYVGLGSNFGRSVHNVRAALRQLSALPSTRLIAAASLYRSSPVGPRNQPDFVNTVAVLETALEPLTLLAHLQRVERQHGRVRLQRWGRRTLDLDLLLYDGLTVGHPRLQVPHPRMHERLFVLAPLHELNPRLSIPGKGAVSRLLEGLSGKGRQSVQRL